MSTEIASSSDSSSHDIGKYDVFLSFSGKDTRHNFTGNLYKKLKEAGFHAFLDDDGIERGRSIKSELQKAIQESRISIVILSRNYASSGWCLDELVMILQRRKNHRVLPVFYDVDPSDFRNHTGSVAEAFLIHEEKLHTEYYTRPTKRRKAECYESTKDKITGWRAALIQVADLAGVPYKAQIDGYEYKCIEKIVKVVENTLRRSPLSTDSYLVGIDSRVWEINMWLNNNSNDVGILVIYGIGGIGKTTIAKWVYSANMKRFDSSSFLTSIGQLFKRPNGLLHLQKKLLSDILGQPQIQKPPTKNDGWELIKRALHFRRVLLVLDDVDQQSQLYEILQMRNWLRKGSKIIITTRRLDLSRAQEAYQMYKVQELSPDESLELFCWHAFGQDYPEASHEEVAMHFVARCQGLPLALKVIGSSLYNKSIVQWKDQLEKLREFPNKDVTETLKISFDSLDDDNDMNIFLDIACFFVGKDKDFTITILQGCNFYASIGIQNLIDRCLLTIDQRNKLIMHQLIQDMGKQIVRGKSTRYPENCSRLWNHKDSLDVLRSKTGTENIEGLILDLKTSMKKALETSAFERMHNLRILQLNFASLNGCYKALSRKLKWLCWDGFNLNSIPNGFPLEGLVVLDMRHSTVKYLWQGTKNP